MTVIFVGTTITSNPITWSIVDRYRTVPIAKEPAPYRKVGSYRGETTGSLSFITPQFNNAINTVQALSASGSSVRIFHQNRAYGRIVDKLGEVASFGSTIAEAHSVLTIEGAKKFGKQSGRNGFAAASNSVQRIISSAVTLTNAIRYLKRGNLKGFLWYLKARKRPGDPSLFTATDRAVSSWWLTYWFAISPLVQDIYTAVDVLTSPMPKGRVRASSAEKGFHAELATWYWYRDVVYDFRVSSGATFQVVNPNTVLRSQLGFNNWLKIGLDVIPFSFFGDWISNLSQVIGALGDFDGMSITNSSTNVTCKASSIDILTAPADPVSARFTAVSSTRELGLVSPILQVRLPQRLSLTRAATAVALLLVLFTGKK